MVAEGWRVAARDGGPHDAESGKTTLDVMPRAPSESNGSDRRPALVVIWWQGAPERAGEVLLPGRKPAWFGRSASDPGEARLGLVRQRPGENQPAPPIVDPFLSRRHLRLVARQGAIGVEHGGKQPLVAFGKEHAELEARPGDVIEVRGVCAFICVERPALLEARMGAGDFGEGDADGIVGESEAAWQLRSRIRFVASRSAHVLVTGESGTGKELVARALHRLSPRGKRALVARNAATLPASLLDAELFGNAAGYPNAGMAERPGLIGQADGSTLFLDEIGELPEELHAHLLRVLDAGEYQRLGEARTRASDFRFVAATNRGPQSLKADLAARLALSVHVPSLCERREDIPLLARHIVRRIAAADAELAQRFLSSGEPCFSSELMCALTQHEYSTHVRELEALVWRSLQSSRHGVLERTREVQSSLSLPRRERTPEDISPAELRAALARHAGVKEHAWRELGLSSRYALLRLMRKLGEA